jgi:hypothetical protein
VTTVLKFNLSILGIHIRDSRWNKPEWLVEGFGIVPYKVKFVVPNSNSTQ